MNLRNVTLASPFCPDFLLRITDTVDIKQPLQTGRGHKMGNKIMEANVVVFFHPRLR
jgi:hypothetical protein